MRSGVNFGKRRVFTTHPTTHLVSVMEIHSSGHPSDPIFEVLLAKVHVPLTFYKGLLERPLFLRRELKTQIRPGRTVPTVENWRAVCMSLVCVIETVSTSVDWFARNKRGTNERTSEGFGLTVHVPEPGIPIRHTGRFHHITHSFLSHSERQDVRDHYLVQCIRREDERL